jgi:hypothetical protein
MVVFATVTRGGSVDLALEPQTLETSWRVRMGYSKELGI